MNQTEAARLKNRNLDLQKLVAELRAQKAATPVPVAPGTKRGEQVQKPIPPGGRTHVVAAKENLGAIRAALEAGENKDFEVVELPGLNHLFQTCETGAVAEYGQIEETIAPAALETMSKWILRHVRK